MTATTIPAPVLADWQSNDPQRMLAALRRVGVSEDRIDRWGELCEAEYTARGGRNPSIPNWWARNLVVGALYCSHGVPFLRCMFGGEFAGEWEECAECDWQVTPTGRRKGEVYKSAGPSSEWIECTGCSGLGVVRAMVECPNCFGWKTTWKGNPSLTICRTCDGIGRIPKPLIDPRWRTSTVMDLAQQVRGGEHCDNCNGEGGGFHNDSGNWLACGDCRMGSTPPQFALLPILADALEDAGCDNADLLEHCRSGGPHVPGECWVMRAVNSADLHTRRTDPARSSAC